MIRHRLRDEVATAAEKIAAEAGHAEMAVPLVDAIGARAQLRHVSVVAGIAVQPQ